MQQECRKPGTLTLFALLGICLANVPASAEDRGSYDQADIDNAKHQLAISAGIGATGGAMALVTGRQLFRHQGKLNNLDDLRYKLQVRDADIDMERIEAGLDHFVEDHSYRAGDRVRVVYKPKSSEDAKAYDEKIAALDKEQPVVQRRHDKADQAIKRFRGPVGRLGHVFMSTLTVGISSLPFIANDVYNLEQAYFGNSTSTTMNHAVVSDRAARIKSETNTTEISTKPYAPTTNERSAEAK